MEGAVTIGSDTMSIPSNCLYNLAPLPTFAINSNLIQIIRAKTEATARKRKLCRENQFVLSYLPTLSNSEFKSHFRLQRFTIEGLENLLGAQLSQNHKGGASIGVRRQILMTIWVLANQESFRGVATRFGLDRGFAHRVFMRVIKVIFSHRSTFIYFPQGEDLLVVERGFQALRERNFPGAVGCVDGCHIAIPAPVQDKQSFYNRNKYHSVILQGICDHKLVFINVFAGWSGAAHDQNVWRHSEMYRLLTDGQLINERQHILGDKAYAVTPFIMVPYKDNGHLTHIHTNFNRILSSTTVVIEQAFGMLKSRFRRLKKLDMVKLNMISKVIVACCILHNICIRSNDIIDVDEMPDEIDYEIDENVIEDQNGSEKRLNIANQLWNPN